MLTFGGRCDLPRRMHHEHGLSQNFSELLGVSTLAHSILCSSKNLCHHAVMATPIRLSLRFDKADPNLRLLFTKTQLCQVGAGLGAAAVVAGPTRSPRTVLGGAAAGGAVGSFWGVAISRPHPQTCDQDLPWYCQPNPTPPWC